MEKDFESNCVATLGVTPQYIVDMIYDMESRGCGAISLDYVMEIAENCIEYIVDDLISAADNEEWNEDDIRLAFGRALKEYVSMGVTQKM